MGERIVQEVVLPASPARVYRSLTESELFSQMSGGAAAQIDAEPGGAFACFGGMILGRNIECAPGERLVQAWRVKTWEPGVYSIVRFELAQEGDDATRLRLEHVGFPSGQAEHLSQGWNANYLEPLQKQLT